MTVTLSRPGIILISPSKKEEKIMEQRVFTKEEVIDMATLAAEKWNDTTKKSTIEYREECCERDLRELMYGLWGEMWKIYNKAFYARLGKLVSNSEKVFKV
jgi:hypothetical protein